MPNHVTNIITYEGDRKQIAEMLEAIKNDELGIGTVDFQKIIPMPDDIYRGNLGRKEQELYGDKNWYDWSRANWGTKWNCYGYQEIMLMKLYGRFGMDDGTNFDQFTAEDYPTMSDLYELIEKEFMAFDSEKKHLYTEEMLQNICLGLNSMCKGAEAKYFDGHTNIRDAEFICFGVKGLMDTNKRLKDTLLFNILSYMSNQLLGKGNTVAAVDELYLWDM